MRRISSLLAFLLPALLTALQAAEPGVGALPFDRALISRLSVDGKPRSLAIRQGADTWLAYDLERAKIFKVWQAPEGKPGLIKKDFVTRAAGKTWLEDVSEAPWELRQGENIVPLAVRYLGCSQRESWIELRWELRHAAGVLKLHERIPLAAAPAGDRVVRELRVEPLGDGETLLPPRAARDSWRLPALTGADWHRLTLP